MTLLRTVAIAAVFLALFAWGLFSSPFANHAKNVPSSEREPAFRDNFYDVAMRGHFAWIVGYHGTILRSQDQGLTWELQPSGTKEAPPNANRTPLNVNGPTWSMPTRCATKANPQIAAVSKSNASSRTARACNPPSVSSSVQKPASRVKRNNGAQLGGSR